ncbi:MAG TPA: GNAT family N-acetyltransferase [Actinotalea sp.]|nr:GNAT family N-acetyltransferase [Actinotalea sp.]
MLLATDRAALMLQLVPYLIGKREVSIAEAAEDFQVGQDEMRAMVEKLTVLGLPGDGGYWQMSHHPFDIDWTLLDEQVRVADLLLPAGQVELVAVDEEYEHRGLARALMDWAHERSAARGHLLQLMIGIPYFYRLFGYEYAIDIPPARTLLRAPEVADTPVVRAATDADLPALVALQDAVQARADVAVPHPAARWRAVLHQTASQVRVVERDGAVVASARVRSGDAPLVAEAAAVDEPAALALLAGVARDAADPDGVEVVERPGTVTSAAWDPYLDAPADNAEQYYVRIPGPAPMLDALRPLLARRLAGVDAADRPPALVVSTFGAHYRLPVTDAGLGLVEVGGPMQDPGEHRAFGVAPDQLGAVLLGPRGLPGLGRIRPDVYGNVALGGALFPPMTADVLSYYLPW